MIILAVDYGDVRTGIAMCDKSEMLAVPLTMITETETEILAEKISVLAKENRAEQIVVGLPKNMDGTKGFRAQACEEFGRLLEEKSGVPVVMRDERCTTISAHTLLNDTNTRGRKRKSVVDKAAAVIILQDYLDYRRNMR